MVPNKWQVSDPDTVREIICDGPMNVQWSGQRGTITFTHPRAKAGPLFEGKLHFDLVVNARIAISVERLIGLRDLLNRLLPPDQPNVKSEGGAAAPLH